MKGGWTLLSSSQIARTVHVSNILEKRQERLTLRRLGVRETILVLPEVINSSKSDVPRFPYHPASSVSIS